ncbi:MAG TPA: helix-turn-helix domain-containing protein [Gaiellaceae bacterium]|nr:helix-turn-helix domain-containing protein [Gaiellaceae bacterium]
MAALALTLTLGEAADFVGTVISMRSEHVDEMGIGEFASRSRLSARALRIYDELGLLPPARVDEDSGYRFYEPGQLKQARLIASLRQLHFPLAEIKAILPLEPAQAAERVRQVWAATESKHSSLRALATYLIDELSGTRSVVYEVKTREIPERSLLCVKRNVTGEKAAWAFGKEFIALLRHYKFPQIEGRAGAFFQIFWGEVSEDSDGPIEWCRPVPADQAEALAARCPELTLRTEPAHGEAFVPIGDGQLDGADWQVGSRSLEAWSDQQQHNVDVRLASLGLRITYLPSEVGRDTYQDFAIPFTGQARG